MQQSRFRKISGSRGINLGALILSVLLAGGFFSSLQGTPEEDFSFRCAQPGVVRCEGFDQASSFTFAGGLWNTTPIRAFQDFDIKRSGVSSLRFDIHSNSPAQVAGSFDVPFNGPGFGQGQTFYVQYAQRFDPNFVTIDWRTTGKSHTSPKFMILYQQGGGSCANVEISSVVQYGQAPNVRPMPVMYSACGGRLVRTKPTDFNSWYNGVVPYYIQQGSSAATTSCIFNGGPTGCFFLPANQWLTFYYKISIGTWGQPNSKIEAWVNGHQWVNIRDYVLINNGSVSDTFGRIKLTPYMTAKDPAISHPLAHTWYDELIVSSQPIAWPGSTAPPAPTNVQVTQTQPPVQQPPAQQQTQQPQPAPVPAASSTPSFGFIAAAVGGVILLSALSKD